MTYSLKLFFIFFIGFTQIDSFGTGHLTSENINVNYNSYFNQLMAIKLIISERLNNNLLNRDHIYQLNELLQHSVHNIKRISPKIKFLINNKKRSSNTKLLFTNYFNLQKLKSKNIGDGLIQMNLYQLPTQAFITGTNVTHTHVDKPIKGNDYNLIQINDSMFNFFNKTLHEIADLITNSSINVKANLFSSNNKYGIYLTHKEYGSDKTIEIIDYSGLILDSFYPVKTSGQDAIAEVKIGTHLQSLFNKGKGNILKDIDGNEIELILNPNSEYTFQIGIPIIVGCLTHNYLNTLSNIYNHNNSIVRLLGSNIIENKNLHNINILTEEEAKSALLIVTKAIKDIKYLIFG